MRNWIQLSGVGVYRTKFLTGQYGAPTGFSHCSPSSTRIWNPRNRVIHHILELFILKQLVGGFHNSSFHCSIWGTTHEKQVQVNRRITLV
ncbi:hypothetical protein CK203_014851 [Vitis vinifera]|uniref:Uncharacterized protein n=1 Tax=Vitis vinifera TaxID=29760 RepID=A0A438JG11_VITVI|nr:hypothetical protein CK203_014851 [Vitis vinifera]